VNTFYREKKENGEDNRWRMSRFQYQGDDYNTSCYV